jgi:hypothetical protein
MLAVTNTPEWVWVIAAAEDLLVIKLIAKWNLELA